MRIKAAVQNPVLYLDEQEPLGLPKYPAINILAKHRLFLYEPHVVREFEATSLSLEDFAERLEALREAAGETGIVLQDAAVEAFETFLSEANASIRPKLTLRPHGELRALWESEDSRQVGITFGQSDNVSYVMFTEGKGVINHHYGVTSMNEVCQIIDALELLSLIRLKL